jgi:hypothetical protein
MDRRLAFYRFVRSPHAALTCTFAQPWFLWTRGST